jgi:ABC-type polar amino acid transport system ATPase subunit
VEGADAMSTILHVEDVHLSRGAREILRGVHLAVDPGEVVALMGASGSGKTTILRAIVGLEEFQAGRITVGAAEVGPGTLPAGDAQRRLRRAVGMVFQFHCLFEHLTALANITLAPIHAHHVPRADAERRAHQLLESFGVQHRAHALPRELSGGEAQRVAIARALAVDPPLLLMDEPTASLDPDRRAELAALVRSLVGQGRALVVATHDEEFARAAADHVLRVREGLVQA